jgi:hypothetical protein
VNFNVDEIILLKGILKCFIVNIWTGLSWLRKRAVVNKVLNILVALQAGNLLIFL